MMATLDPTLARLRTTAPFDVASPRELRALGPHVDRLRIRAGTVLAREGRSPREVVVVISGDVVATRDGREVAPTSVGPQIGAVELIEQRPHDRTWTAGTDLEVVVVNGPAYRWLASSLHLAA